MVHSILIPENYSWVIMAGIGTIWVTTWQTYLVGSSRRRARIDYPQAYAEKAEVLASKDALVFNCAQRAHMNTMEMLPQTLFLLLFSGLKHPNLSTGFGAAWVVGRILYTLGYTTGVPAKRRRGFTSELGYFGLLFTSTWTAGQLVLASLPS